MARDHTCINHPSREAVARCKQCNSPVCPECAEQYPAGTFCSRLHAERYTAFGARKHEVKKSKVGLFFWLIVLILAALVAAAFVGHYMGLINLPVDSVGVDTPSEEFLIQ